MEIKLGDKAEDQITGFQGTVTAKIQYLTGCVQYKLEPRGLQQNGNPIEGQWCDEGVLTPEGFKEMVRAASGDTPEVPGGPFGGEPPPKHP